MKTLTCCQDHILTENIWFVCSETSYSGDRGDVTDPGRRPITEDRATQSMEAVDRVSQYRTKGHLFSSAKAESQRQM